jgi:hypothetical protein
MFWWARRFSHFLDVPCRKLLNEWIGDMIDVMLTEKRNKVIVDRLNVVAIDPLSLTCR